METASLSRMSFSAHALPENEISKIIVTQEEAIWKNNLSSDFDCLTRFIFISLKKISILKGGPR